jgi:hypothetical protein
VGDVSSVVVVVPVDLDALWSPPEHLAPTPEQSAPTLVLDALVEFRRLPRTGPDGDVNPSRAPIGEELVLPPFSAPELRLEQGTHLHWRMPRSLTRVTHARHDADAPDAAAQPSVPPAPNRWLVVRRTDGAPAEWLGVVESDHLASHSHAAGRHVAAHEGTAGGDEGRRNSVIDIEGVDNPGVPFPVETAPGVVDVRSLGRVIAFDDWDPLHDDGSERVAGLTAFGHGDPLFGAFYPNCRSVFGFQDESAAFDFPATDLTYEVIGWYHDPGSDPIDAFLADIDPDSDVAAVVSKLIASSDHAGGQTESVRVMCYGRVDVPAAARVAVESVAVTSVAVGHSGPEAVAAYTAAQLASTNEERDLLERRIEAALLADELAHRTLDANARFHQACHRRGFIAVPGEQRWEIRVEADAAAPADATSAAATRHANVPDALSFAIGPLNDAERRLHRAITARESAGRRLFDDWYRYLIASYPPEGSSDDVPDADRVRNHLEQRSLVDVERCDADVITAKTRRDERRDELAALLDEHNRTLGIDVSDATARRLSLQPVHAARYWRPREPALLLGLENAGSTSALTDESHLDVVVIEVAYDAPIRDLLEAVLAHDTKPQAASAGSKSSTAPLLLEWQVAFGPELAGDSDISSRFFLGPAPNAGDGSQGGPDLYLLDSAGTPSRIHHEGRAIVSPAAGRVVAREIVDHLTDLFDLFEADRTEPIADTAPPDPKAKARRFLSQPANLDEFVAWYHAHTNELDDDAKARESGWASLVASLEHLAGATTISMALGGFNDALLARRQSYQLPVIDPLAIDDYDDLVGRVRTGTQGQTSTAPLPLAAFTPVRAGTMTLSAIRLVDRFGRITNVDLNESGTDPQLLVAESMRERHRAGAYLSPRLLQPTRLDVRWLSAGHHTEPATGAGLTSPICGWLLPNELDSSLVIYREDGRPLGVIDDEGIWSVPPGVDPPKPGDAPMNPHLGRVVSWLQARSRQELATVHGQIIAALEQVNPESSGQHQALALLMGRPVAIVRAELAIECRDRPVGDPSWETFDEEIESGVTSSTDGIGHLRIPVRIGDHSQLNDGTVGYWREEPGSGSFVDDRYHAATRDTGSVVPAVSLSPDGDPERITMLIDPRGAVNVVCGIVPTTTIAVPHEQYDDALRQMRVTFETSPILMPADAVELPLPTEPGFAWSWLQRSGQGWAVTPSDGVTQSTPAPVFVRSQQIREGWLQLAPSDPAPGSTT